MLFQFVTFSPCFMFEYARCFLFFFFFYDALSFSHLPQPFISGNALSYIEVQPEILHRKPKCGG